MAVEMGKPVTQGRAEAEKCASVCDFYAERAAALLSPEAAPTEASQSYVAFEPLGVVLAVMPWNFPLWQVFRFAAPALMAGNVGLLKHASNVTGCALAIEELFETAGLPKAVFRTLVVPSSRVAALIEAPEVRGRDAHRQHARGARRRREGRRAAQEERPRARRQRPVRRAGGRRPRRQPPRSARRRGSSTAGRAASPPSASSWSSRCSAASRNGSSSACRRGAWATRSTRRRRSARRRGATCATSSHRQVRASLAKGARARLGCAVPEGPGAFYPPSVLGGVTPGMPAFDEELFGPVAAVIAAQGRDGRDPARERHRLRPRRRRLHRRPCTRRAHRAPGARGGVVLRERVRALRSAPAVRRDQGVRLRPRAGGLRDPRVREREDGVRGVGIGESGLVLHVVLGWRRTQQAQHMPIRRVGFVPTVFVLREGPQATPPRRLGCARRRLRSEPRCSGLGADARRRQMSSACSWRIGTASGPSAAASGSQS